MAQTKPRRTDYKRADRPEQKDERRKLILRAAAAELNVISTAEDFTISALARRAGLAKGTVYLYFETKSAILRALLWDALEAMLNEVIVRLDKLSGPVDAQKVARTIRDSLKNTASSPKLVRVLKSLAENPGRARQEMGERITPLVERVDEVIVRVLPTLKPGEGQRIMRYSWAFFYGLSEMAERRSNRMAKHTRTKVEESLGEALTLLIEGYLARAQRRK